MLINFTVLCNYYIEFRNIDNNETEIVLLSIPPQYDIKNEIKLTKDELTLKYFRIAKLIISTYNTIKDYNPMIIYTVLKLIDNNPGYFPKYCENFNNPYSSYIEFKLLKNIDLPLIGKREVFYN